MNSDLMKAGLKGLAALATIVTGGTLAKKGREDYQRYKQNNPNKQ